MNKDDKILIAHGGGGSLTGRLIREVFLDAFDDPTLSRLEDGAVLEEGRLVFTTDAFVVKPLLFPGGDIGKLSVWGTVNDLAVMGARPLYVSCAFIIEEGLGSDVLARVVRSMAEAARRAGVSIVAGDTKVVERGAADEMFITTSGIGMLDEGERPRPELVAPGDVVLLSGPIGDHGMAVLTARDGLYSSGELESDCAPLNGLIRQAMDACRPKFMRDPTRGGVATVLNELASAAGLAIELDEAAVPVRAAVRGACELLGFDPLYVACEGRVAVVVGREDRDRCLEALRSHPLGSGAAAVGEVVKGRPGRVTLRTAVGGRRILDLLTGEQLPRIC
jgi:hydrogenase expression/formation protein HypE